MTTHILVESLDHADQARERIDGAIHWHSTSPVVIEALSARGERVLWADATLPDPWSDSIGLASRAAVLSFEHSLAHVAERLNSPRLVPFVSQSMAMLFGLLCYKRAILDAFATEAENPTVVGVRGLTAPPAGHFGVGSFDTVFRNIADGLNVELLDGAPFDPTVLEKDFDRGTITDRILSLMDLSRGQILSRKLRFMKASRIDPKRPSATVFVGRDNDTIREMLPHLLDHSFSIARLPRSPIGERGSAEADLPSEAAISAALGSALKDVGIPVDPTIPARIAHAQLVEASRYWRSTRERASDSVAAMIAGDGRNGPAAIITNTIGNLAGCLQADAADMAQIPTILVEHGVSGGLSRYHEPIRIWSEPVFGATYLVCAKQAERFFREEPRLDSVDLHTIGLPDQTRRIPLPWLQRTVARYRFRPKRGERVIVYLARASQNNFRKLSYSPRDCDLYKLQRTMCRDVMPKLRGRAVIKLYSTRRYIDGDAFWDFDRAPAPVSTVKAGDFRFFRAGVDVIILESPLSTIGWAFGSDKPIVYLADPNTPLLPSVEKHMAEAIFLIDLSDPDWTEQVVDLINRPDADLLSAWHAKKPARTRFQEECIFGPENPGRRGADAVARTIGTPTAERGRT